MAEEVAAPTPKPEYTIDPSQHASVRQTVLSWAVTTSSKGESGEAILARAQTFLEFVLDPLRADLVQAALERSEAQLH